ncbi:hypothetical protein TNCV_558331 [Trichonephila clavipes]|nr:hypothetical protein TNCV_558331 [Trichonephila clavipes]
MGVDPAYLGVHGQCLVSYSTQQSNLQSELIAIDEALRIIKTMTSPDEIWILCDSRSAIQHLSDWTNVETKHRSHS